MVEIIDYAFPSVDQWNLAINGMRNAFKSTDKSDSEVVGSTFIFGEKDRNLLNNLISEGDPSHRKVLRQLPLTLKIKAPLYFLKQFDTYKVGTTANSESTMHTLLKEPFKLEDFSTDGWYGQPVPPEDDIRIKIPTKENGAKYGVFLSKPTGIRILKYFIIDTLNSYRDYYLETKDKEIWRMINGLLPQSYNQIRTWTGNYEVLRNMYHQRGGHKLQEWKDFRDWIEQHVPYAEDLIVCKV